jgi:Domain of unknown function (DUF303).
MSIATEIKRPGVTIEQGPSDWQIIQRNCHGFADITLEGTWVTDECWCSVQTRIVEENSSAPVTSYLDWQDAETDIDNKRFNITLCNIPQGGLYRIETRIRRPFAPDPRAMRGDYIHHIGVGDVFIIAGQSNASGSGKGTVTDGPILGVHTFANDERWKLAVHPVEDATGSLHPATITGVFHGSSPWLCFGRMILAKTGIPVGLVPTALGGSSIQDWIIDKDESGHLFDNMMDMLQKAGGKTAGILWYQGESDVVKGAVDCYYDSFANLVSLSRMRMHNDTLPFFIAQLNSISANCSDKDISRMRELQRKASHELDQVYMVVTLDLPLSDEIHNSSLSNLIIGERFADSVLENIYGHKINSRFPEVVKVWFKDYRKDCLLIRFDNIHGDWTRFVRKDQFVVEDNGLFVEINNVDIEQGNLISIQLSHSISDSAIIHGSYGKMPLVSLRDDSGHCIIPFSMTVMN